MNLEPGRELDALVAEKVIGWDFKHDLVLCTNPHARRCENCLTVVWDSDENPPKCEPKKYSTDIAAAWEVVGKLQGELRFELRRIPTGGFWAYFGEEMSAEGKSAPHAICLAALKAMEGK